MQKANTIHETEKSKKQMLLIEGVRVVVLSVILAIILSSHILPFSVVDFRSQQSLYVVIAFAFALNAVYLLFFNFFYKYQYVAAILFFLEIFIITALTYFSGLNQSLFLFMFLVNIILAGFVYRQKGAYLIAGVTAVFFTYLLLISPELKGQTLFFSLAINNLSFLAIAYLSSYLSEQMDFLGVELKSKTRDVVFLKEINQTIVDTLPVGLVTIDEMGQILMLNPLALRLFGIREDFVDSNLFHLWPDLIQQKQNYLNHLNSKVGPYLFELEFTTLGANTDKRIISGRWISLPILEQDSRLHFLIVLDDITDIKKMELNLRQSEKMAAIGQLAAGIAHEIRNPLASISGSIQMLQLSNISEDEKRLMSIVLKETDRLNHLISEFLEYSRPDQIRSEKVNVAFLLAEVLEMIHLNPPISKKVLQEKSLPGELWILGQADKLRQVFVNLIIYSYQALENNPQAQIKVNGYKDGEHRVCIEISDNGCGMTKEVKSRMFEPFHTTKAKGTGLGLAISHKILTHHKAQVDVDSEVGRGTVFKIRFPYFEEGLHLAKKAN